MIYVSKDSSGNEIINMTRGDDAALRISLSMSCGDPYEMGEDEYLIFSVREKPSDDSELQFEVETEHGSSRVIIAHSDTENMEPGFYSAEAQLMTRDGQRVTVWPKLSGSMRTSTANRKNFCLMTEVVKR